MRSKRHIKQALFNRDLDEAFPAVVYFGFFAAGIFRSLKLLFVWSLWDIPVGEKEEMITHGKTDRIHGRAQNQHRYICLSVLRWVAKTKTF